MSVRTLGKYVLRERLGRGGMAEVYKAYQPGLERFVAIKVLHPYLAEDPGFLSRFQREAQAVAQLRHPHIVQVFDFDVEQDQHYMVMEYLDGQSLKAQLDDRFARGERMPEAEIVSLFSALLEAVQYAHTRGMIHRDLKPANVMIDSAGRVVLTDFGIARIVNAEKLTQTGVTMGSPAYMSPEQGQGDSADERTDIYALGIMLFECLAGHVPFEGDTSVSILLKHATAPIPSVRALRADVPEAIELILYKALAKNPADRYQSADEMRAALQSLRETDPRKTVPGPPPLAEPTRPRKLTLNRRWGWGLLALAGLAIILAGAAFAPGWLARRQADADVQAGQTRLAAGDDQLAVDAFTAALAADPRQYAALTGRAAAYEQLQQIDEALADLTQVITLGQANGLTAEQVAYAYAERARLTVQYQSPDDPAPALADLDRAVALAPSLAHAYFVRGWAVLNFPLKDGAPDPRAALPDLQRAVALDAQDAEAQYTLARAQLATTPADALTPANRAVELAPNDARYRALRAEIRAVSGDFTAAADDLSAALQIETEPTAQATWLAERGYLRWRVNHADPQAAADVAEALRRDPAAALPRLALPVIDPGQPRPSPADLERAHGLAPSDDPIWQAILKELSH